MARLSDGIPTKRKQGKLALKKTGVRTMSRKTKQYRKNRHHCYPSKDTRHKEEIKVINAEAHRRWHYLVSDMTPEQSVRYIAHNFMPKDIERCLIKAMK